MFEEEKTDALNRRHSYVPVSLNPALGISLTTVFQADHPNLYPNGSRKTSRIEE